MRAAPASFAALSFAAALPLAAAQAARQRVLPFIEDDAPKAMAEARSRKVPVFVENWAPW